MSSCCRWLDRCRKSIARVTQTNLLVTMLNEAWNASKVPVTAYGLVFDVAAHVPRTHLFGALWQDRGVELPINLLGPIRGGLRIRVDALPTDRAHVFEGLSNPIGRGVDDDWEIGEGREGPQDHEKIREARHGDAVGCLKIGAQVVFQGFTANPTDVHGV